MQFYHDFHKDGDELSLQDKIHCKVAKLARSPISALCVSCLYWVFSPKVLPGWKLPPMWWLKSNYLCTRLVCFINFSVKRKQEKVLLSVCVQLKLPPAVKCPHPSCWRPVMCHILQRKSQQRADCSALRRTWRRWRSAASIPGGIFSSGPSCRTGNTWLTTSGPWSVVSLSPGSISKCASRSQPNQPARQMARLLTAFGLGDEANKKPWWREAKARKSLGWTFYPAHLGRLIWFLAASQWRLLESWWYSSPK